MKRNRSKGQFTLPGFSSVHWLNLTAIELNCHCFMTKLNWVSLTSCFSSSQSSEPHCSMENRSVKRVEHVLGRARWAVVVARVGRVPSAEKGDETGDPSYCFTSPYSFYSLVRPENRRHRHVALSDQSTVAVFSPRFERVLTRGE